MDNKKTFTKDELVRHLIEFSIKHQTKRISKKDIDGDKFFPSSATFKRHFGSWKRATELAGLNTGIITGRPQDPKITVSNRAIEIINGELLGDGCLSLSGEYKSNACFSHSTANIYYGKYLYGKLKECGVPLLKEEFLPPRNNSSAQFRTRTSANKFWTELYYVWYQSGVKIIPDNIELTKQTCLHWYLGDGYFEDGTSKISTCGFTKDEIKLLSNMLSNIGFKASINKRSGGYYVIRFSKHSYGDFLNWIGQCPVRGYEHRWAVEHVD